MTNRQLVKARLATRGGTPLAMSNEFKDRPATAKAVEEARNSNEAISDALMDGDEYHHSRLHDRTHETDNNTILETYTSTDSLGNKHYLYLERKPATKLLEMREAC